MMKQKLDRRNYRTSKNVVLWIKQPRVCASMKFSMLVVDAVVQSEGEQDSPNQCSMNIPRGGKGVLIHCTG